MNGASLQKRVDSVFRRVGGMDRTVCVRTYTEDPAQDSLIGRATDVVSYTDTIVKPQPVYRQLSQRELVYLTSSGKRVTADDFKVDFSPLSISQATLEDHTAVIVLKDSNSEQVLRIVYVNTEGYQGKVVLVSVIARSVDNTA